MGQFPVICEDCVKTSPVIAPMWFIMPHRTARCEYCGQEKECMDVNLNEEERSFGATPDFLEDEGAKAIVAGATMTVVMSFSTLSKLLQEMDVYPELQKALIMTSLKMYADLNPSDPVEDETK